MFNQKVNVTDDNSVLSDIAATAKSVSPFISFAMTYVMVAVGEARRINAGKNSVLGMSTR